MGHVIPPVQSVSLLNRAELASKLDQIRGMLEGCERVIVAFSGGVDSTLLAKLARDALGKDRAPAVTADSPSMAREDLAEAVHLAQQLDLDHLVIQTSEVVDPAYRANDGSRCYHCKRTLFVELEIMARQRGAAVILYGAIAEDLLEERPGQRAATEHGICAPLQEAGFTKAEIRELARQLGLPNWDRPPNACLSSRLPHGREVTEEALRQIEQAESFLRQRGFRQVRVRHLGLRARIEVDREAVVRFAEPTLCRETLRAFSQMGFAVVSVSAYRPGGADRPAGEEVLLQ